MTALYVGMLLVFIGMGTVFAFLGLMVWCVGASARILSRFAHLMPEKEAPRRRKETAKAPAAAAVTGAAEVVPVIAAAIHKHLSDKS